MPSLLRTVRLSSTDVSDINSLLRQLSSAAVPLSEAEMVSVAANSEVVVCRTAEGRIVGMARLKADGGFLGNKGTIEDVVVDQGHRGKGLGKALMQALTDRARQVRLTSLDLTSAPHRVAANELYKELGYILRVTNVYRLAL